MNSTQRLSNWPAKLALFLREKERQPFVWGSNDCCTFVCDWLIILTGTDPARALGIRDDTGAISYDTALGAARVLENRGGVLGIAVTWAELQGWVQRPIAYAQRGDMATVETEYGLAVGVVDGPHVCVPGATGIVFTPIERAVNLWHIP